MAKGGHAHSGPPADPNALRRDRKDDAAGWTILPLAGRNRSAPEWPIPEPTERELAVWAELWAKPVAVEWERLGHGHLVALYVRQLVLAEDPDGPVARLTVVRQYAEELALTDSGLLRHRYRIEVDEKPAARSTPARPSSRERLRVVDDVGPKPAG